MATYVMSDIHGLKQRLDKVLEKIALRPEDTLYILGDVIDRGKEGIAILQMTMEKDNIHLLMGNHEYMMLEYFDAVKALQHNQNHPMYYESIHRWNYNHNAPTLTAFANLTMQEQEDMLMYIRNLPIAIPDLQVQQRHFYLVHACPCTIDPVASIDLNWCRNHGEDAATFLWTRIPATYVPPQNRTLIYGHTATMFYQDVRPYAIWYNGAKLASSSLIDLDCGCAADNAFTQLGCLRLDDFEVFYG